MNVNRILELTSDKYVINHSVVTDLCAEDFPPHVHEGWELLFFLRGEVSYHVLGKSYKLRRGDLVVSRPTVLHRIEPTSNERYERFNIILDEGMIPESIISRFPDVDVFCFGTQGRAFDIFERIGEYAKHFEGEELLHLTECMITELVYNLAISDGFASWQTVSNTLIASALIYIDNNLTSIRGVDEICEHLYITKSHLHHLFITHLGVTPKRYVNSKRLLLAQRLIRQGKRATEAASEVGYLDYATFFRGYKKFFGYPPSEENTRINLDAIVG